MDDELPGYFDMDEPVTAASARSDPPPPPRLPPPEGVLIPVGAGSQLPTPTTVVVQVVPTPPDLAVRRLEAWAAFASSRPWRVGHDRLDVGAAADGHVRVVVRGRARPALVIDVACAPWSSTRAELHVEPVRAVRDRRRYFRAAHAVLDRLARELR